MGRFAARFPEGAAVRIESARPRRVRSGGPGPTLTSEAAYRKMRDLLMRVAMDAGCNRFDLAILFDVSPNHVNKRLRELRDATRAATMRRFDRGA